MFINEIVKHKLSSTMHPRHSILVEANRSASQYQNPKGILDIELVSRQSSSKTLASRGSFNAVNRGIGAPSMAADISLSFGISSPNDCPPSIEWGGRARQGV